MSAFVGNDMLFYISITTIALFFILCVCMTFACSFVFTRASVEQSANFRRLIEYSDPLQMLTTMTIIGATCLAFFLGKIQSEAFLAIISGIAGYILGEKRASDAKNLRLGGPG